MKVMHLVETLDPAMGGLPVVPVRLGCTAAERGRAVAIAAPGDSFVKTPHADIPGAAAAQWIAVSPAGIGDCLGRPRTSDLDALEGVDLLHCHGVWSPTLVAMSAAAAVRGIPYLITPHGMLDPWSLSQSRWKKRLAMSTSHRSFLRRAAAYHALNDVERDRMGPLGLPPPVAVIGNGIDPRDIPKSSGDDFYRSNMRVDGGQIDGDNVVLFLGRLHHKKGPGRLAEAFGRLVDRYPRLHLAIVGPDGGEAAGIERLARWGGWKDRLWMPGPIYGAAKYAAMRDAAVYCLPSRQEGFSIAILEAMACGTAVVISPQCHFDEVAVRAAGLVVDAQAAPLAAAIDRLIAHPAERAEMGRRGSRWVRAEHTWAAVEERMWSLYQSLVGGAGIPSTSSLGGAEVNA